MQANNNRETKGIEGWAVDRCRPYLKGPRQLTRRFSGYDVGGSGLPSRIFAIRFGWRVVEVVSGLGIPVEFCELLIHYEGFQGVPRPANDR